MSVVVLLFFGCECFSIMNVMIVLFVVLFGWLIIVVLVMSLCDISVDLIFIVLSWWFDMFSMLLIWFMIVK